MSLLGEVTKLYQEFKAPAGKKKELKTPGGRKEAIAIGLKLDGLEDKARDLLHSGVVASVTVAPLVILLQERINALRQQLQSYASPAQPGADS